MTDATPAFEEAVGGTRIKDLGLSIAGTALEPTIAEFTAELERAGIGRIRPRFYLSDEWGVPMDTIAIAIPFYLARPELARLHLQQTGHIEGLDRLRMLRYLRHEMGHVLGYAYKLYLRADWREHFGSIDDPYVEGYRPKPFDRRFVRHLPGWYAQKHPDEDWAETFAVWMTPGGTWRSDYEKWPVALAKLEYCDRVVREVAEQPPLVTTIDLDEDAAEIESTLQEFYKDQSADGHVLTTSLDELLRDIFGDIAPDRDQASSDAATLLRRLRGDLCAATFQWTGYFPEHVHSLVNQLADRAEARRLAYAVDREQIAIVSLTAMVTTLAMKYIVDGKHDH